MSKISYRDKIILLTVLVIAIFVCGFFFLIKPKNEELKSNQATYNTKKSQLDKLEKQVDQIYEVQEHIVLTHDEAIKQAETFSEIRETDELDEYVESNLLNLGFIEEKGEQAGLEVSNAISYTNPGTSSLTFYYYTPSTLTYPIYTAADLNGEFKSECEDALKKSTAISARVAQTVVSSTVNLAYKGTEAEVIEFLDLIADSDEKVLLNSIDISQKITYFGYNERTNEYIIPDDLYDPEIIEYSGSLTFQFYSAQTADLLHKDLFEETSDGKSDDLEKLVEDYENNFKEEAESEKAE